MRTNRTLYLIIIAFLFMVVNPLQDAHSQKSGYRITGSFHSAPFEPQPDAAANDDSLRVRLIGRWANGPCNCVTTVGNIAFFGNGAYLEIVDFGNPANPNELSKVLLPAVVHGVAVSGNYACVTIESDQLCVIHISQLSQPAILGYCDVGTNPEDVAIQGNYAYVASWHGGLYVIDISQPDQPENTGFCSTPGMPVGVAVSGNYAYVADSEQGLRIINIAQPDQPVEVGFFDTDGSAEDVVVSGNYAYVADYSNGLRVINISQPQNPYEAGFCDTPGEAIGIFLDGIHAYVADGRPSLRIIDVSQPNNPREIGDFQTSGGCNDISVSGNYAYIANVPGDLQVLDVSLASNPTEAGTFPAGGTAYHIAINGNYAYVASRGAGLRILDISSPDQPFEAGRWEGNVSVQYTVIRGNYAYLACWWRAVRILDISNPIQPVMVGAYSPPGYAYGIALDGNTAYVAAYTDGLRAVDISDPAHPNEVGFFDTGDKAEFVTINNGYAYVADKNDGLRIIDISQPASLHEVGYFDTEGRTNGLAVNANYAFVADDYRGLRVLNISQVNNPTEIGFYDTGGTAYAVGFSGIHAYLADGSAGLRVFDVSQPSSPIEVGYYETSDIAVQVTLHENYAYVADYDGGIYILEFLASLPGTPELAQPTDGTELNDETPTLSWSVPSDPNGDQLHFKVEIANDDDFAMPIAGSPFESRFSSSGFSPTPPVTEGSGTCSFTLTSSLADGDYWWRVTARDGTDYGAASEAWKFTVNASQKTITRTFNQGWNMFSINVSPAIPDIQALMSPIVDKIVLVKNNSGETYIPAYGINTIGDIDFLEGYQAYLSAAASLNVDGQPVAANAPIDLAAGWSMISYLPDHPIAAETALASIASQLKIAKNNAGEAYIPAYGINQIGQMQPGQGYQVYLNGAGTLTYPASGSLSLASSESTETHRKMQPRHYRRAGNTGENATVVLPKDIEPRYSDGAFLEEGDEIGIFNSSGICCGAIVWQCENAAITIWGDDSQTENPDGFRNGEQFSFRVWRKHLNREYPVTIEFHNNHPCGYQSNGFSVLSHFIVDLRRDVSRIDAAGIPSDFRLLQNYPNPFNPETTIEYHLPQSTQVVISIYDIQGHEVRRLINETRDAGYHTISWDARDDADVRVASGIYFYRITAGDFSEVKKCLLMK
ncbi:T9SS type A sorting domain-containing protein [candidate division KSB1 bacterium]|nr:T9SS type A sorting domain-containing protein [candidate division KSB1 bacterium]